MNRLYVLLITVLLNSVSPAWAGGGLPSYYPDHFPMTGRIDRVDVSSQAIVINDMSYTLETDIPVHTQYTQFATVGHLKQGMQVGFSFSNMGSHPRVSELWVLPDDDHSRSLRR